MNCREFEADIVDLARGAGMSAAAAARRARTSSSAPAARPDSRASGS